jgi:hypothetical protein
LAGLAWGVAQLFIFGKLAPIVNVEILQSEFSDENRDIVLVEARFVNNGKTRLTVTSIAYSALITRDWSTEGRIIASLLIDPYPILVGETKFAPGEGQQALVVLPWSPGTRSMPVYFYVKYVEALDHAGFGPFIRGLLGKRYESDM